MSSICDDILYSIFEYFDVSDIFNSSLVSKQFNDICDDDFLWKTYYERDYDVLHDDLNKLKNKDAYKKCHNISELKRKLHMSESIIDIMKLQKIMIHDKNTTKNIPQEIKELVHLECIYLSDNEKENIKISPEIKHLINLQKLFLVRCKITVIPQEIMQLINLQLLDLSNNKIINIPLQLTTQLVNLRLLLLSNNKITKIPPEIIQLINLRWLHLSYNKITEIPINISQFVSLRHLYLANNKITIIPLGLTQLISLQVLVLTDNKIKQIPDEIRDKVII